MTRNPFPTSLQERRNRLKGLHPRLCQHLFGIDREIQRLLEAFNPWYQFAEAQTRPRTIGLWGMTGTGKSSLVRALVDEMGLGSRTFWLDAGVYKGRGWLDQPFERIEEQLDGKPFILVVDEFQHARTVVNGVTSHESEDLRRFWEMMDSGRVATWPSGLGRHLYRLEEIRDELASALEKGSVISKGKIVQDARLENEPGRHRLVVRRGNGWAIPERYWREIIRAQAPPTMKEPELMATMATKDGSQLVDWLDELIGFASNSRIVDTSKMLVILLGNLDELYVGDKEPVAELDPDVLLLRHQDIGTAGVQHALLNLFRIEQVGRMGVSHIIFPPIGRATVNVLVQDGVNELTTRLSEVSGHKVEVDASLVDYLAASSSIAVLGARPVVQAIQNVVPLLLSQTLDQSATTGPATVRLAVRKGSPVANITTDAQGLAIGLHWPTGSAGEPHDPLQLHYVAVHETGHLLCGVLLEQRKPLQACVATRDPNTAGFVIWDHRSEGPMVQRHIVPRLATLLGGWAAERIVFGAEGLSAGSNSDLRKASAFALEMVGNHGMGNTPLFHAANPGIAGSGFLRTRRNVEQQAKELIEAAQELATHTLTGNRALLDEWVERLMAERSIGPAALEQLTSRFQASPTQQEWSGRNNGILP